LRCLLEGGRDGAAGMKYNEAELKAINLHIGIDHEDAKEVA
jgi:hypothetical protein